MYNSTIRQKMGSCPLCNHDRKQPLTKGLCNNHYWQGVRMKSVDKLAAREETNIEPDLQDLIGSADAVFSRYIRTKAIDENGFICCFICGLPQTIAESDAMHYVKRGNMFLRYDERNVKAGCKGCNQRKGGNYIEFTRQLEKQSPGVTEYLLTEGNLIYKYTHNELKQVITEYTLKLKQLK